MASSTCDEKACTYGVGAATAIGGIGGTLANIMCVPTLGSACILGNLGAALNTAGLFATKFCDQCAKENEEESKEIIQGPQTSNDNYIFVSNVDFNLTEPLSFDINFFFLFQLDLQYQLNMLNQTISEQSSEFLNLKSMNQSMVKNQLEQSAWYQKINETLKEQLASIGLIWLKQNDIFKEIEDLHQQTQTIHNSVHLMQITSLYGDGITNLEHMYFEYSSMEKDQFGRIESMPYFNVEICEIQITKYFVLFLQIIIMLKNSLKAPSL